MRISSASFFPGRVRSTVMGAAVAAGSPGSGVGSSGPGVGVGGGTSVCVTIGRVTNVGVFSSGMTTLRSKKLTCCVMLAFSVTVRYRYFWTARHGPR